jgi:ribosomal protein S18 acetylase RimI-like enzyme
MNALEHVGREVGVQKAMLTVFTSNVSALSFYTKLGYNTLSQQKFLRVSQRLNGRYTPDAISPKPRSLRRTIVQPDYQILSKVLHPMQPITISTT